MKEEILKILNMVQEGKMDEEKAAELIEALKNGENKIKSYNKKLLKVNVNSKDGDKVNINLPVEFIKNILNSVGNLSFLNEMINVPNASAGNINIDLNLIAHAIDNNLDGEIVNITSQDGDIVRIAIE